MPETLQVKTLMEDAHISTKLGEYRTSVKQKDTNKLHYKRKFIFNKGSYQLEDYEAFREFMLAVVKNDKQNCIEN